MHRIAAQRHRLNRAMNFARSHIAQPIDLNTLADVACYSKYHFTRSFNAYCQETPLQFLWRLRVERAARMLVFVQDDPITDIAIDCGFSCSQTFSRSFRQRFRTSPREFRAANQWSYDGFPYDQRISTALQPPNELTPETGGTHSPVRVELRPSLRVAYIRHIGPYGNSTGGIAKAFGTLKNWAGTRAWNSNQTFYIGLCPDHAAITPADCCVYDACIPVDENVSEDDVVSIQTIPGGTYAVLHVKSDSPSLHAKWEWLTSRWLPESGMVYDPTSRYEYYPPANGAAGTPQTGVDLCLRIRELTPAQPEGSRTA